MQVCIRKDCNKFIGILVRMVFIYCSMIFDDLGEEIG